MSLATVSGNRPWVCEVHFVNDDELSLYFVSLASTRHCREIAVNPHVAGNIVKQHALTESPHGVYFEGMAEPLEDPTDQDIERYCKALSRDVEELTDKLRGSDDRRMYKIKVSNWAVFGKFGGDKNQKHELPWS